MQINEEAKNAKRSVYSACGTVELGRVAKQVVLVSLLGGDPSNMQNATVTGGASQCMVMPLIVRS